MTAQSRMTKIDTPNSNTEPQAALNTYCPSVPISVYRELVGELRQTQAQLDILKSQNQQLRQEVEKVVHSTHTLKQVVESFDQRNVGSPAPIQSGVTDQTLPLAVAPLNEVQMETTPESSFLGEAKPIVEVASSHHSFSGSSAGSLNRWTLTLIFGSIGLSAFLLGFFVVPTLVKPNNR